MNHIAARMHRNSQNLLIVVGRDLATSRGVRDRRIRTCLA
jgi:hypothetical protein